MSALIDRNQLSQRERSVLTRHLGGATEDDVAWHKFDVNMVDALLLLEMGWAHTDVESLRAGRPYYDLRDAARRLSTTGARRLRRLLAVAPLRLPGEANALSPSADAWLSAPRQPAPAEAIAPTTTSTTTSVTASVTASPMARLGAPSPPKPYVRIQRQRGAQDELESLDSTRFPALVDAQGQTRYADPRFVVVQAHTPANDPALLLSLQTMDLHLHKLIVPDPALMVLRLGSDRHGLAGLSNCLMALKGAPWVDMAEPAWLGFDDLNELLRPHVPSEVETLSDTLGLAPPVSVPWNLRLMDWPVAGTVPAGSPAVWLAVVDTGLDLAHPAFAAAPGVAVVRERLDMTGGDGADTHGHGTAVASVLVAQRGTPWFGLAPGCSLLSVRVPMAAGVESYALRRAALLALRTRVLAGTQRWVVNLSWRTAGDVALIRTAIESLTAAGALVVCSAGNEGDTSGRPHFPSDYPGVLSVGALDPMRQPAPYSNLGPQVDFMAPGGVEDTPVVCAAPGGGATDCVGSSFAAPHVAAVAALLWSRFPDDSADEVLVRLRLLCERLAPPSGTGHGMPRLGRLSPAPSHADTPATPAPAPLAFGAWPQPGEALLSGGGALCALKPITRRILAGRRALSGWTEVSGLLGMTPETLDCLRRQWPTLP